METKLHTGDMTVPVRPRVAFVVQRAGREVNGGAEALCLQVAGRMARHWRTEVLTTCALDYMEWRNHYPPGVERIGDVTVHRFAVDEPRDVSRFNRLSGEVAARGAGATLAEQQAWMRAQGPVSTPLLDYLEARREDYDAFIFFGYLYATTYFGLPLVRERAILAPLTHDEWTIHLPMWDTFFGLPRGFVFNTEEERAFTRRRFPALPIEGPIAGVGIEPPARLDPTGFRRRYGLGNQPFLLYAGRIDASKGCGEMFDAFARVRRARPETRLRLVLIGKEVLEVPYDDDIIHLGFVSEQEKWDAMAACDWFVMPSPHESLSIVLLEAWAAGRPALVNAESEVLVGHCRRGGGGLWYQGLDEWVSLLLDVDPTSWQRLGEQGRRYVGENYFWDRVEQRYCALIPSAAHDDAPPASPLGEPARKPQPRVFSTP